MEGVFSPVQDIAAVKTSREQQLQLKAVSAGRGRGRGKGQGRGRGASKANDANVPSSSRGKRPGSAQGGKAAAKQWRWEQFMEDNNVEEWYEETWTEEWGEEWGTRGWEEPARKAADEYAWWDGRVSLSKLATPQNQKHEHVGEEGNGDAQSGREVAEKSKKVRKAAEEVAEPKRKAKKAKDSVPDEVLDEAKAKKQEKAEDVEEEEEEKVAEKDNKSKLEAGNSSKPTETAKGKPTGKKQKITKDMLVRRSVPQTASKQVKALMNFRNLFAGEAEREDVKQQMLSNLTPTIMCSLQNLYWKRPGFGVKSNNEGKDIAYFKFNWDSESAHDANGEFAWRCMAAVALKCADIFVAWTESL